MHTAVQVLGLVHGVMKSVEQPAEPQHRMAPMTKKGLETTTIYSDTLREKAP